MNSTRLWYTTGMLSVLGLAQPSTAKKVGFLELPLKRERNIPAAQGLVKRAIGASLKRAWDNSTYTINVDIGTPKQRIQLAVDVGTYVTWVNNDCDAVYFEDWKEACEAAGTYNESLSATSECLPTPEGHGWLNNDDGSSWRMYYATDDLTIQGTSTLKNVTIGIYDYHKGSKNGALGLGWGRGMNSNYSSIVDELVDQGVVQTKAFGLALGDQDGLEGGSLVLGGVDTKKFSGALQKVPVIEPSAYPIDYSEFRYWTNVDGVTLRGPEGDESSFPGFKMMVHSNDELSYLPDAIANTIAQAFGIYTSTTAPERHVVPCRRAREVQGSLDLRFGGLNVSIPYRDLVFGSTEILHTTQQECVLSVFPWDRTSSTEREIDFYYLGHSFLRAVYAVFDQDGRNVWLARRHECGSDVRAITVAEGSIAGMKGQCDGDAGLDPGKAGGNGGAKDDDENVGLRHGLSARVLLVCLAAWLWMGL